MYGERLRTCVDAVVFYVSCMGEVSRFFVRVSFFVRVALFELLV